MPAPQLAQLVDTAAPVDAKDVPEGHEAHASDEGAPIAPEYRPAAQPAHASSPVLPVAVAKLPAGQREQSPRPVVAAYAPAAQSTQLAAPAAANWPALQLTHTDDDAALGTVEDFPAAHGVQLAVAVVAV